MGAEYLINEILNHGVNKLGLDNAIVSKIDGNIYKVVACLSQDLPIKSGDEFELSKTYCFDVMLEKSTKFYEDAAVVSEILKHPCYLSTQLRAYIGTPIFINDEIWGTLNYSSLSPHRSVYTDEEIEFLEAQAERIADILHQGELVMSVYS